jgi:hypothetical protein
MLFENARAAGSESDATREQLLPPGVRTPAQNPQASRRARHFVRKKELARTGLAAAIARVIQPAVTTVWPDPFGQIHEETRWVPINFDRNSVEK